MFEKDNFKEEIKKLRDYFYKKMYEAEESKNKQESSYYNGKYQAYSNVYIKLNRN